MSNRGQFRPTPLTTADRLPGDRSATVRYEVVAHFEHVLLVGHTGHSQESELLFSPDEARRFGFHLMAVADLIENREKEN